MKIQDGTGKSYEAKVDSSNRLRVKAVSLSAQHDASEHNQQAYQVVGTATLAATTVTALHIKNTSNKDLAVTFISVQIVDPAGGTALPSAANYFTLALGRTHSTGGVAVTPINIYAGSGNTADVTVYNGAPTLTGTANEIDRFYPDADGDRETWFKDGAVILPKGGTLEVSFTGDHTSGTAYARVSFYMED